MSRSKSSGASSAARNYSRQDHGGEEQRDPCDSPHVRATHGTLHSGHRVGQPAASRGRPGSRTFRSIGGKIIETSLLYHPRLSWAIVSFFRMDMPPPPDRCEILVWSVPARRDCSRPPGRAGRLVSLADRCRSSRSTERRNSAAKILVAGGGRCNVTHWRVTEADYAGSTPPAIRKVLGRFTVDDTVQFFLRMRRRVQARGHRQIVSRHRLGPHGARWPLVSAATQAGATLVHPARVEAIERVGSAFHVVTSTGVIQAGKVILCTGGKSLPKSGSDGAGFEIASASATR